MICPNCQKKVPEGPECMACGIIISKFRQRPTKESTRPGRTPQKTQATKQPFKSQETETFTDERSWPLRPVSDRKLAGFYNQFSLLLEAGVIMTEALGHLKRTRNKKLAAAITQMIPQVSAGVPLSDAMKSCPHIFPTYVRALVSSGEQTGDLPKIFHHLAGTVETRHHFRIKLFQSLIYPFILFTLIFFLLPLSRLFLNGLSSYLQASLIPFLITLIGLIIIFLGIPWITRLILGRALIQNIVRWIPIIGGIQEISKKLWFSRQLSTAMGAGMEAHSALSMSARSTGDIKLINSMELAKEHLNQGKTLTESLEATNQFDDEFMVALSVGETSGKLDQSLTQYTRITEASLITRLEVAVKLLSVGILMGVYVYGMYRVYTEYQNIWNQTQQQMDGIMEGIETNSGSVDDLMKEVYVPGD